MELNQIRNEFKDYNFNENQLIEILNFYKAAARVLSSIAGEKLAFNKALLKFTLNSSKFIILQIKELVDGFKE